jgi:general secretion pathway protein K
MNRNNQEGAALLLVLWVLVLLTGIVTEFAYSMRTEVAITRNFKEEQEAYYAALAGVELAKAEILSARGTASLDDRGELVFGERGNGPSRQGTIGAASYVYSLMDEERKINLNSATPDQLRALFRHAGLEGVQLDTIVDSILDWRDPDQLHRLNGAEEDYYRSLARPYSCKDGPFDAVEEMLLVRGVTPEILYGPKGGGATHEGVAKYLTVHSSHAINLYTAEKVVLEAIFGTAGIEPRLLHAHAGLAAGQPGEGVVASSFFTILSTGRRGEIRRTIKAVFSKKNETTLDTLYWDDNWTDQGRGIR